MLVNLKVIAPHRNEFAVLNDKDEPVFKRDKAVDDRYAAPPGAAQGLIANGFCEEDEPAAVDHD